jgi:hypothetical protein
MHSPQVRLLTLPSKLKQPELGSLVQFPLNQKGFSCISRDWIYWGVLHTGQSSKAVANSYLSLFEEGDGFMKKVWVGREWKPKVWLRGYRFSFIKKSIINKILAIRLEGLFWARNKVGCSFGFGLWAWPLETSHYARPKAPLTILVLAGYFSAHFFNLDSQQSLATQSHGLSTWMAIVWSGPECACTPFNLLCRNCRRQTG